MPYIPPEDRPQYKQHIDAITELLNNLPETDTPGHLNYIVSKIINNYIAKNGERYYRYNYMIGALECIKQELYRQQVASYENKAIEKNGNI